MKMYRLEQAPRYTKLDTTVIPISIPIPSADATGEARKLVSCLFDDYTYLYIFRLPCCCCSGKGIGSHLYPLAEKKKYMTSGFILS